MRWRTLLYILCLIIIQSSAIINKTVVDRFTFSADILGTWSTANITNRDAVVTTLNFPGNYSCSVYHFTDEMKKVFQDFIEREVFEDDFIFISNKNFLTGEAGGDESDLFYFNHDMQSEKTFAFLKSDFEGEYKFLPIRLEQFEALYELGEIELLMEGDSHEKYKPRTIEVKLVVSDDCFVQLDSDPEIAEKPKEIITFAESTLKDTILSHLVMVLHNIFLEVKEKQGKMWKDSTFDRSCFVNLETIRYKRYSAPFEILECCHYSFGKLADKHDRALPLECEPMHEAMDSVKTWVYCISTIIFIFLPVLVSSAPSKPQAYKKLRGKVTKSETMESGLSSASISEDSESSVAMKNEISLSTKFTEPTEMPRNNKTKSEKEALVHDNAVDMSNTTEEITRPALGIGMTDSKVFVTSLLL